MTITQHQALIDAMTYGTGISYISIPYKGIFKPKESKVTTKADLHREYARVIDLCEGTSVDPWECVKSNNFALAMYHGSPIFNSNYDGYTFALAIVENRPVFENDYIYLGIGTDADKYSVNKEFFEAYKGHKFSWSKPKPKTVMVEMLREDAIKVAAFFNISNCASIWDRAALACKKALETQ